MPQHMRLIQTHYAHLSEKMDPDSGLLTRLYSKDVITHREMKNVEAGKTFYDRNEELLSVMRRKSEVKFREFVAMLRTTDMADLADVLEISS